MLLAFLSTPMLLSDLYSRPGSFQQQDRGKGAEWSGLLVPKWPQGEIQLGNLHSFTCKVCREGALGFQGDERTMSRKEELL